jgi:hypothetical protein
MDSGQLVIMIHNQINSVAGTTDHVETVQVLTEDGDVFDISGVKFDREAGTLYLECELAE